MSQFYLQIDDKFFGGKKIVIKKKDKKIKPFALALALVSVVVALSLSLSVFGLVISGTAQPHNGTTARQHNR